MKKIVAAIVSAMFCLGMLSALDISVGARGNVNFGVGSKACGYDSADKNSGNVGGGFGIYADFGLLKLGSGKLGIQPEFDVNFNNGAAVNYTNSVNTILLKSSTAIEVTRSASSIDIPVIVTYNMNLAKSWKFGLGAGIFVSFPFDGKWTSTTTTTMNGKTSTDPSDGAYKLNGANFGMVFDVNAGYKLGPGFIVADLRYMFDFANTRNLSDNGDPTDLFSRGLLNLGAGYELKF